MEIGVEENTGTAENNNLLDSKNINSQGSPLINDKIKFSKTQMVPEASISLNIPSEKKDSIIKSTNTDPTFKTIIKSGVSQNNIENQAQVTEINNLETNNTNNTNNESDKHSENFKPTSVFSTINVEGKPTNETKSLHFQSPTSSHPSNQNNAQANVMVSQEVETPRDTSPPLQDNQNQSINQMKYVNQKFENEMPYSFNANEPQMALQHKDSQFIESHAIYSQQNAEQIQNQNHQKKDSQLIEAHSIYNVNEQRQPQPFEQPQPEPTIININQDEINEIQRQIIDMKVSKTKYLSEDEISNMMKVGLNNENNDNNEKKDEIENNNDNKNDNINNGNGELNINQEANDINNVSLNNRQSGEGEGEGEGVQTMNPPNPIELTDTLYTNILENNNENNNENNIKDKDIKDNNNSENNYNNNDNNNNDKDFENSKSFGDVVADTQYIDTNNLETNETNKVDNKVDNEVDNKVATSNIFNDDFGKLSKTQFIQEEQKSENNFKVQEPLEEREISINKYPIKVLKIEGEEERQFCPDFISDLLNKIFG